MHYVRTMIRLVLLILCSLALRAPASAMDFSVVLAPDGLRVVSARGPIVAGDAERLAAALRTADRDPFGNKRLLLNSVGGQVGEALAMVKVMDQEKVTTIVESKAECASACAQILFLSGVHRYVLDGGRLGLHSCREGAKGGQSTSCNDLIAQNALAHGTSYASIMSFMQFTDPGRMRWFDSEEADCWGFTRWPPGIDRGSKTGEMPLCIRKPPTSTGKLPTR
ncbi:MAG: hypothetical protein EBY18_14900 [Alphaproteobacteria bacterium]|nr:hypothetical protein [Alphaproteobacteria bacterium]